MGQIVFGVRDDKIRVGNCSNSCREAPCLSGRRNPRSLLDRLDGSFSSGEADKMFIETVEPAGAVPRGCPVRDR